MQIEGAMWWFAVLLGCLASTAGAIKEAQIRDMNCNGSIVTTLLCTAAGDTPEEESAGETPRVDQWTVLHDPWVWVGLALFALSRLKTTTNQFCHDEAVPKREKFFTIEDRHAPADPVTPRVVQVHRDTVSEDDPHDVGLSKAVDLAWHEQWIKVESTLLLLMKFLGWDLVMLGCFKAGCFSYLLMGLATYSICQNAFKLWQPMHTMFQEETAGEGQVGVVRYDATNIYMSLDTNIAKVVFRFSAQVLLAGLYVFSMWSKSLHPEEVTIESWFSFELTNCKIPWWTCILLQISADTQMSASFGSHATLWAYILRAQYRKRSPHPVEVDKSVHEIYDQMYDDQEQDSIKRLFRCIFAFITHGLVFDIIVYTMPLLLIQSDLYIDFVKDSFAVTFIVTLDLIESSKVNEIVGPVIQPIEVELI